jgi:hypothetical protein
MHLFLLFLAVAVSSSAQAAERKPAAGQKIVEEALAQAGKK